MDKILLTLGGPVWVNLVNTRHIYNKKVVDILLDKSKSLQWMTESDLLVDSDVGILEEEGSFEELIEELHSLRNLCKLILSDLQQNKELSGSTYEQLNGLVQQLNIRFSLASGENKLSLVSEGITIKDHVLYSIIHSIVQTVGRISADRFRQCEHEECILSFADTSKSGRRRWCSMELCGNRQKAAEFYARKKKKKQSD